MLLSDYRCLHHPAREAVARCPACRQTFCRECITEHEDRVICAACLKKSQVPSTPARTRWKGLAGLGQCLAGLLLSFIFFYWLGEGLLAIPSSFHDGTVWKAAEFE